MNVRDRNGTNYCGWGRGGGGGGCKREGGWQAKFNSTKRGCRKVIAMLKAEEAGRGGGALEL